MGSEIETTLRHFILCDDTVFDEQGNFNANRIYEYFSAPKFPASVKFHAVVGLVLFDVDNEHVVTVNAYQDTNPFVTWRSTFSVDKQNEIINFVLDADPLIIKEDGFLIFRVELDGKLISMQYVEVRKEVI